MSILYKQLSCGAAGILPYTIYNNKIYVLLGNERRGYSDFGGYKDGPSESTEFCAAREFSEETLGLFIDDIQNRGNTIGVEKSTLFFNEMLTNDDFYKIGLVAQIENHFNRYAMYICPLNRFLLDDEFRSVYLANKETPIHQRIENTEKNHIYWFEFDSIFPLMLDESLDTIKFRGHVYKLFGSFLKTIREPKFIQFFTNLKSYDNQTIKSMIDNIYKLNHNNNNNKNNNNSNINNSIINNNNNNNNNNNIINNNNNNIINNNNNHNSNNNNNNNIEIINID